MGRCLLIVASGIFLSGSILTGAASGQAVPSQNIVSSPAAAPSSNDAVQPVAADSAETAIDPASLLPDLPSLSPQKASLIGGTLERLDRVRDQLTIRVFGGGKMNISFDPRTHIYHDGALASASDLRQGDRVYIDTILDGSTVFARSIRLKTTASAGENQGIVTSYRADKGELMIRDALSPQPLKVRLTSQTRLLNGGQAASPSDLVPGTLVAVKFGARRDGSDIAQEVSVLAVPGASFTFAGRVTAVDLRLGLLVLTSSTDGKTYEIHIDPSTVQVDDSLRLGSDITAVAKFDGSHYVARGLTINSQ
jgi:hypothetical protein